MFYKKTRMLGVFLGSVIVMLYLSSQGQTGAALFTTNPDSVCTLDEGQPYDTPMPIMGKVAAYSLQHVGISLDLVKDTIREAGAWIKQKYLPEVSFNCATF
jgi:threonine synthase